MAGISSLLKSAQAMRDKIRAQEDAVVSYNWSQSAKTYADFVDYSKYLQNRINNSSDPTDILGYTRDINSARTGYISNEIQRKSIDVIEGRATNTEKYNAMVKLFYQALDSGNADLAQSLHLQLDNLSVTIQNEAQAAQKAAKSLALNGVKTLGQLVTKIKKGTDLVELADGKVVKPIPALEAELAKAGDTNAGFFNELRNTVEGLRQVAIDTYNSATTQAAVDKIEQQYGGLITGDYKFNIGGKSMTAQDIVYAAQSAAANNPLYDVTSSYDPATGQQKFTLTKNRIDNFVWVVNDDGTYSAIQETTRVQDPTQKLSTQITDDGYIIGEKGAIGSGGTVKGDSKLSIQSRLASAGIVAKQNEDGTLSLTLSDGRQVTGSIGPDGNIRYFGDPGQYSGGNAGLYEVNVLNGQTREVAPDETSDFGVQSQFGGLLSQATKLGKQYIKDFSGQNLSGFEKIDPTRAISTGLDLSGRGSATVGSVLQGASNVQERIAAEKAKREAELAASANLAQSATNFNVNTTPIRQMASNGQVVRQLKATQAQAPTINKVSVAKPKQKITSTKNSNTGLGKGNVGTGQLQGGGSSGWSIRL